MDVRVPQAAIAPLGLRCQPNFDVVAPVVARELRERLSPDVQRGEVPRPLEQPQPAAEVKRILRAVKSPRLAFALRVQETHAIGVAVLGAACPLTDFDAAQP